MNNPIYLLTCCLMWCCVYKAVAQRQPCAYPLFIVASVEGQGLAVTCRAAPTTCTGEDYDPVQGWSWDFGNGHAATGSHSQQSYREAGRYKMCVTA